MRSQEVLRMTPALASDLFRSALWTALEVGGPLLAVLTAIAVVFGILAGGHPSAGCQRAPSRLKWPRRSPLIWLGSTWMIAALGRLHAQGLHHHPMDRPAMNLTIGNDVALAFGLLFARAGGVMSALPTLLGVSMPVRIRADACRAHRRCLDTAGVRSQCRPRLAVGRYSALGDSRARHRTDAFVRGIDRGWRRYDGGKRDRRKHGNE